ncbi:hypothetical protein CERSUDRAFT_95902 [Gelatoporia subvermispora B]|uniref:Fe2OG dioxygenase domain-containing protein n=1 Tax=Ceriporiopsis subvermispora (strain B) TaxID=914234 RepID=M2RDT3_CERS8|nr:hypothetical protein CERSUDRAFT_95902 [Gelatoporia subvermispora B]
MSYLITTTSAGSADERLKSIGESIISKPPFCSGVFAVGPEDLIVYYGKNSEHAGRIDFAKSEDSQIHHLPAQCDPASFGKNGEDVMDESYRKASKLDTVSFALKFDPLASGLLDMIRLDLLEGGEHDRPIRQSSTKPGLFFKSHKDTPRGQDMFGSLVIVFPTSHEGGSLRLCYEGKKWSFDSATALQAAQIASVGYAAFYSDVEHEITPMVSGYRVTVTYNLFYTSDPQSALIPDPRPMAHLLVNEAAFRLAIIAALNDAHHYFGDHPGFISPVVWATPYSSNNQLAMPFACYGNYPDIDWGYVYLCVITEIPPPPRAILQD